jgi:hypothetical protein
VFGIRRAGSSLGSDVVGEVAEVGEEGVAGMLGTQSRSGDGLMCRCATVWRMRSGVVFPAQFVRPGRDRCVMNLGVPLRGTG